jgi:hypothetical protein
MSTLPFKDPLEKLWVAFDFSEELGTAVISSAVVAASLRVGTDATPGAVLSGTPVVQGGAVLQVVQGGVAGATYGLVCTATLSDGSVLVRAGQLPVRSAFNW